MASLGRHHAQRRTASWPCRAWRRPAGRRAPRGTARPHARVPRRRCAGADPAASRGRARAGRPGWPGRRTEPGEPDNDGSRSTPPTSSPDSRPRASSTQPTRAIAAGALSPDVLHPARRGELRSLPAQPSSSPVLLELPPVVAAEIQLRLLVHLDVAVDVSRSGAAPSTARSSAFSISVPTALTADLRAEARAAITGRGGVKLLPARTLRSQTRLSLRRRGRRRRGPPQGGARPTTARPTSTSPPSACRRCSSASACSSGAQPASVRCSSTPRPASRGFGFDLHDGPIQDVLVARHGDAPASRPALSVRARKPSRARRTAASTTCSHGRRARPATAGDGPLARVAQHRLAAARRDPPSRGRGILRAQAASRPSLTFQGDPELLEPTAAGRHFSCDPGVAFERREHSGATRVDVASADAAELGRRDVSWTTDDGFEVNRSLALAAQRGRLGIVGMGERMRMLGGTFEIDSRPGGPDGASLLAAPLGAVRPRAGGHH